MIDRQGEALAARLVERLTERSLTVSTAESCTGGMVSALITEVPGSSSVFGHGFVTYANDAKTRWLGVPQDTLDRFGAVSAEVALAMAKGARAASGTDLAVGITGIAGPGGGSPQKPVGLVYIGVADAGGAVFTRHRFPQVARGTIRTLAARAALRHLLARV